MASRMNAVATEVEKNRFLAKKENTVRSNPGRRIHPT